MYKVVAPFYDLEDYTEVKGGKLYHHYDVGDAFPRDGKEASEDRIAALISDQNKQGRPLIEAVAETVAEEAAEDTVEKTAKKTTKTKATK